MPYRMPTGRGSNYSWRDLPCHFHLLHLSSMAEGFRTYTEETHSAQSIDGAMGCSSRLLLLDLGARLVLNSAWRDSKAS